MTALPITSPDQLRKLEIDELPELCKTLAYFTLSQTSEKEGHLVSSLAVTELTVALHYVFNTPDDILIWDVGHQAYIHKVLTDRSTVFHTNRTFGGISGFTSRPESPYDPFSAGHSSTSISAIGGFAEAARLLHNKRKHIAVIGDGALTGGMAFEALNHLGISELDILLVLNDNEESIDASVGGLHEFQSYQEFFESLGWGYHGPADGHDVKSLVRVFRQEKGRGGVRVVHIKTKKKKLAVWLRELGLKRNEPSSGTGLVSYQDIFVDKLIELGKLDKRIVAITPAMLSGSSLSKFQAIFPKRTFDVGIAEQHAVTFAAGLAASGMKPLVHIYSTFAQRGYDQLIHDVALQNLPIVFAFDRAGLVGEDGATHHGAFDLSFLNPIPNLQILAPMDGTELRGMMQYGFQQNAPVVIRFPRGAEMRSAQVAPQIKAGSFRELKKGQKVVVVSLGTIGKIVERAIYGLPAGHIDLRFLKPWNTEALKDALAPYTYVVTIEDGSMRGGLRDVLSSWMLENGLNKKARGLGLPDRFILHGRLLDLENEVGLAEEQIRAMVSSWF